MDEVSYSSPFIQKVADAIRTRHYSLRTEQTYTDWVKRFILFHGKQHPMDMIWENRRLLNFLHTWQCDAMSPPLPRIKR
ncbi:phage integrase N-terminal SAM-like domain-containing protein [Thiolapillus sp.]|uniref:phage integrase N-terminal SAM-like domain-containing protein n=1 Tax=Thiolapillus sp. TaxID=2017437 RepID=UPI003AF7FDB1